MSCSPRWRNRGPHDLEPAPAPHAAPRRRGPRRRRCGVVPEPRAGRAARDHRARPRLRHQALLHGAAPLGSRGLGLVWRRAHRDRRVSSLRQRGAHHFIKSLGTSQTAPSKDLQDALPTGAVVAATWAYANLISDSAGRREAWAMIESAALSTVPVYALKYAVGRERPDQTSDPNAWRKGGGDSFPSWHATAAFAVGPVLAESGNDDYRWVRRLLGYGLGGVTSFERLKHNAHWLSDTVAGAALGAANAHFAMKRANALDEQAQLRLVPIERGAMLSYTLTLR